MIGTDEGSQAEPADGSNVHVSIHFAVFILQIRAHGLNTHKSIAYRFDCHVRIQHATHECKHLRLFAFFMAIELETL